MLSDIVCLQNYINFILSKVKLSMVEEREKKCKKLTQFELQALNLGEAHTEVTG